MDDQTLTDLMVDNARKVFGQPHLVYDEKLLFRDILGFDSVLAVQYILAMEAALDVTLTEDEVDNMHTMGNCLAILRGKLQADG